MKWRDVLIRVAQAALVAAATVLAEAVAGGGTPDLLRAALGQ